MDIWRYGYFIFFVAFFSLNLTAQEIKRFRHITVNEGLAHTDAICFCQDVNGFVWIGTNSGLQRFDGQQLKLYPNTTSVIDQVYNDRITTLVACGDKIWVGSENGIHLFDLKTETFVAADQVNSEKGSHQGRISSLTVWGDKLLFIQDNQIFSASFSEGTNTISIKNFKSEIENLPDDFAKSEIRSIAFHAAKYLWLGTSQGVLGLKMVDDKVQFNDFWGNEQVNLQLRNFPSLVRFKNGRLWIFSCGRLFIYNVNEQTGKYHSLLKNIAVEKLANQQLRIPKLIEISDMLIDNQNNIWIGALNGLYHIRNPLASEVQLNVYQDSYVDPFSIGSSHIASLFEDCTNCLWIGSWGGGASWLDLGRKKFELIVPHYVDDKINLSFASMITY